MCASCHSPHGGREKALLITSPYEVCLACHTEVHTRHQHIKLDPATGQTMSGQVALPQGFPVRKSDGALSCIGCHRPHGSDYPKLWDREEMNFCNQCHPM
jgi:predicted CXXCH cytochrome family protein